MNNKIFIFLFVLIIGVTAFLYKDSFTGYFFQDDWFSFSISKVNNVSDFLAFFIPRTDVIYYRPLGMQVPFFVMFSLFHLNPIPYHLVIFLTHILNTYLVFTCLYLLGKNKWGSIVGAFLYSTSTAHFIPFYWFATFAFVLGPTFFLLSFIYFLKSTKFDRSFYISTLFFLLGILTNELVGMLGFILLLYSLLFAKKKVKSSFVYIIIFCVLMIFRFVFFKPPSSGVYTLGVGKEMIQSLKFYLFWATNWSESITDQLVKVFRFQDAFVSEFYALVSICFSTFIIHWILFFSMLLLAIRQVGKALSKILLFGVFWFMCSLLPVIFFPSHRFAYYLPIGLIGIFFITSELFSKTVLFYKKRNPSVPYIIISLLIVNWLVISYATIQFNIIAHWAPRRSTLSREIVQKALLLSTSNGELQEIYIEPIDEKQFAINEQDGLRIVFSNPRFKTYFGYKEGVESL